MILRFTTLLILFFAFSCTGESNQENKNIDQEKDGSIKSEKPGKASDKLTSDTVKVETNFSTEGFDDKKYYDLLIETHLCNPNYSSSTKDGSTPCSARFFEFYPYNHKREIDDAFLLQVKAGVNNYPYRRLLIFVREKGKLVLMNGIVGYLVERISQPNNIDDLIVAIFDDLGNDKFDRYDVLIRYKEGKYHFIEAIGDLQGTFDTPKLKEKASKAILERINQKELIF